jgi:hypothetical protein
MTALERSMPRWLLNVWAANLELTQPLSATKLRQYGVKENVMPIQRVPARCQEWSTTK